jgi:hypothetical protein
MQLACVLSVQHIAEHRVSCQYSTLLNTVCPVSTLHYAVHCLTPGVVLYLFNYSAFNDVISITILAYTSAVKQTGNNYIACLGLALGSGTGSGTGTV